jgi:hypothetical protein
LFRRIVPDAGKVSPGIMSVRLFFRALLSESDREG